jgi:hypothetical protein
MSVMLRARKLLGIADGSTLRESFLDDSEWSDKDVVCQSIICSSLDIKYLHKLQTCQIAN